MKRICLALPTNRECAGAIARLAEEAAEALQRFPIEIDLVVSDTSTDAALALNARVARAIPPQRGLRVHHVDEAAQRRFLREVADRAGLGDEPGLMALLLPDAVSYGAATNRLFLAAASLGCSSVHRRDSDSRYQQLDGRPVHPVVPELRFLGRAAAQARLGVDEAVPGLDGACPVFMVGGSYVGELSIDLAPMAARDPDAVHELLAQWTPPRMPAAERRAFNNRMFLRRWHAPFQRDLARLTTADADGAPVDMCNIAFHRIHEQVPLPPALSTIASDYFLVDLLRALALPVVQHNRAIDNYYTGERRTPEGSVDYQLRFVRFLLHMSAVHEVVERIERERGAFLEPGFRIAVPRLVSAIEDAVWAAREYNPRKLAIASACLARLGGVHAQVATIVGASRDELLADAERDVAQFARLAAAWPALVAAAKATPIAQEEDDARAA